VTAPPGFGGAQANKEINMIKQIEPMISEFQQETGTTRRVLERIPADKLAWKPHAHSMTAGQLGMHIALIPGNLSKLARVDEFDLTTANFTPPQPESAAEILTTLDTSVAEAEAYLSALSESSAMGTWRATAGGKEVFSLPRIAFLRSIMLNHWYHHRGQLSVYLRLLEVPVPVIYGRSYDESPFD
jgi:uncharacterized damage-inducible protein DinB